MCIVQPYLTRWIEWILRYADDQRAGPVRLAGDVAVIGGVDRGQARPTEAEDIDPLVGAAGRVRAARVGVHQADETVGGQDERRAGAGLGVADGHQREAIFLVAGSPRDERLVAAGIDKLETANRPVAERRDAQHGCAEQRKCDPGAPPRRQPLPYPLNDVRAHAADRMLPKRART